MTRPEYCRLMWASEEAREVWEPRITQIVSGKLMAERASVGKLRDACIQNHPAEVLRDLSRKCADKNLHMLVLGEVAAGGLYSASSHPPVPGQPSSFKVAVCVRGAAPEMAEAFEVSDHDVMGRMLGYPDCCRAFFAETWGAGKSKDPTRLMAGVPDAGPVECNSLLRWLGVRWVSHMPCSWECEGTAEAGRGFRRLASPQVAAWADELLDGPIEWSALNGCAEIKTPLFTISASTDAVPGRHVVRRKGSVYPEAGVRGLRFPYLRQPPEREEPEPAPVDAALWVDNGFASPEAMAAAHAVVLDALPDLDEVESVTDLGCGNGVLLRKIPGAVKSGVEIDEGKARRATRYGLSIYHQSIFENGYPFGDLTLLMPGRLVEQEDPGLRAGLLGRLSGKNLLVYAYGDWATRYGDLEGLCREAGLQGALSRHVVRDQTEAGVWVWE